MKKTAISAVFYDDNDLKFYFVIVFRSKILRI